MKARIHLISTYQRVFKKPLFGMLMVFSLWGTNSAIAATPAAENDPRIQIDIGRSCPKA